MKPTSRFSQPRRAGRRTDGRAQLDHILDPYQRQQKLHEPAACGRCGAVYQHGRWQWGAKPVHAVDEICPACRRIQEQLPAGLVTVHGPLTPQQKTEMIGLVRHQEDAEKAEHPLNRIISIEEGTEGLVISTTDIHLPRRIGEALERAFRGKIDMHFDDKGYFVRLDWRANPGA
jgi:NMD protein affecting ribosome stability and mRNA decay